MTNTQFQYLDGDDEAALKTLVQGMLATLTQGNDSMSQDLTSEDCLEYERDWSAMSRTIDDFHKKRSFITRIDADIDTPILGTEGKAFLNFSAVIHFRNERDGSETTVFRLYGVSFKKEKGRWQAIRDADELSNFLTSASPMRPVWIARPPFIGGDEVSPPTGRDKIHSESEGISRALCELVDAILSFDVTALERLLTDDYDGCFPEVTKNGYCFRDPISKEQQMAAIEKHNSSVEKFEFKDLRIYPTEGGEMGAIAVFVGGSLIRIKGIDSNKKCGYYVRLDKQPDHWKVSMINVAPLFDLMPPPPHLIGLDEDNIEDEFEEDVIAFDYDPDWLNKKKKRK
jgi:hypothetical protein